MLNRWKGETVCIAASGPSLVSDDIWEAREWGCKIIVINETWRACTAANVLYAADQSWWLRRAPRAQDFRGERWTTDRAWDDKHKPLLATLNHVPTTPGVVLTDKPPIPTGANSSFQALALAILWGARRVIFTGLDLKFGPPPEAKTPTEKLLLSSHWHGEHEDGLKRTTLKSLNAFAQAFNDVAPQCAARGVEVINASRDTVLKCFPRKTMREALA